MNINKIIQQLQPIKVELEFDGNEGSYLHKSKEIEGDGYLIRCDLAMFQTIKIDEATSNYPIECRTINQNVWAEYIELWLDGSLKELSDEDYNKLMKGIIKTIEL